MIYKRADTASHRSRSPLLPNYLQKYGALARAGSIILQPSFDLALLVAINSSSCPHSGNKELKKKLHFHALISTLTRRRVAVHLVTQKTSAFTRIVRELNRRWPTGCVALSHAFD